MGEEQPRGADVDVELLERRVAERTRELSILLRVSRTFAASLELQPLLGLILDHLRTVVDYGISAFNTIDGEDLVQREYRGPRREGAIGLRTPIANFGHAGIWEPLRRGEPIVIPDMWGEMDVARSWRTAIPAERHASLREHGYHSRMIVPMLANERLIGAIVLVHTEREFYTPHHAELVLALATHAAVAVENARLYEESKAYAVLQERARLARELHDSVTQNLFSMTLYAAATLEQLERAGGSLDDPIGRNMRTLAELAQGALAEMRMLILELRPGALADEGLVGAVRKLAAALGAREGLTVEVIAPSNGFALEPKAEEELYRLAQEALHNIVKHAQARRVTITIASEAREGGPLTLTIVDDGIGFDADASFPGHMGLGTMAERCQRAGGTLTITSSPGHGTAVRAVVPTGGTANAGVGVSRVGEAAR